MRLSTTELAVPFPAIGRGRGGCIAGVVCAVALCGLGGAARADSSAAGDASGELSVAELENLDLKQLLERTVTSASKVEQRALEAPAIVTSITAQEIEQAGYRTVAEALAQVPGLAINTNHVFFNVGIRGISGGLRGGSRHIKLLIDGHPVAFRPDAQNLLGQELIPIEAVARIEVIRGPASALYGRNAFLGVVNVITKTAANSGAHRSVRGDLGTVRQGVTGGGELLVVDRQGRVSVTLAGYLGREDRSGLRLPASSINAADYRGDDRSRDDTAEPLSLFGSMGVDLGKAGAATLRAGLQNLRAAGEFVDFGPLSHQTQIHLRNWHARLDYSLEVGRLGAAVYAAYSGGENGGGYLIQPMVHGKPTSQLVRPRLGYDALDVGAEARVRLLRRSSGLVGFEFSHDRERIRQNIFVNPKLDEQLDGPSFGSQDFDWIGAYAQFLFADLESLQLAGNLRFDHHNLFGSSLNYRLAAVVSATDALVLKFISGSSFRPPTPEQLYGTPVRPGGVRGSLISSDPVELAAQTALSHELALTYSLGGYRAALNAFVTQVKNRIEYVAREGELQAANLADSRTVGGELSFIAHWRGLWRALNLSLDGSLSYQHTRIQVGEAELTARQRDFLQVNEIYPVWMLKWRLNLALPRYYLNAQLRMSLYAGRLESQSNQAIGRPFVDSPLRELDVSFPFDIVLSSIDLKVWREHETRVQLAIRDIFNTQAPEPGFNGINIPPLGRRVLLSIRQAF